MEILGFSTGLYGWTERYWLEHKKDAPWEELFHRCREAGLDAVELDPLPELVELAKSYNLAVSSAYVGLQLHEKEIDLEGSIMPVARRLAEAGGRDLLINADPKGGWGVSLPKTEEEFKRQGDHLSRIAAAVCDLGQKVSMHNHADDLHNAEGDLRSVIDYASPEVGLCIDTGWAHVAGFDPVEWIRKYHERVYSFHLRNQKGRVPTEDLMEGDMNFQHLIQALHDVNYNGWLTFELLHSEEVQPRRTMVEDTRHSIEFLKKAIQNS
ncbi:MAG: sugar phosphate isomerase/epimerase family protein [Bacillota bacterium]